MSNIQVVGLGALNMDHIHRVERLSGDGETALEAEQEAGAPIYQEADRKWMGAFPGGSAANTIYGLAKLGIKTGFIGVVGDDAAGGAILEDFREGGVDTSQTRVKTGTKTGSTLCFSDKLNFRSIQITPGANSRLTMDDIDMDYINQAEILHISSFVDDAQLEVLAELVNKLDSSVKISFSPGELYARKGVGTLTPLLARTYILFANEKEIKQLSGEDFSAGSEVCLKLGCQLVAVTLGRGTSFKNVMATSYLRDSQREYVVEAVSKEIVSGEDTIGAGDAFATGFLYGLLNGKSLGECGRLGDIVARFSITRTGARQGLPILKELSDAIKRLT